jgi:pimeloyl-ACP methyl ester carboxylesterase
MSAPAEVRSYLASLLEGEAADLRDHLRAAYADIGQIVSEHGIDEARFVELGGAPQWITIKGQDRRAPILLYLHGGPGGAISDYAYAFQRTWEDYFTVVHWDQRGFGRSAGEGDALDGTINLEQLVADAIELVERLCAELGQPKVVLLGHSFGSILALEIAHRRPDLVHVAATIGQVVRWTGGFAEIQRLLIEEGERLGDEDLVQRMRAAGDAPLDDPEALQAFNAVVQGEMLVRGYSWRSHKGPEASYARRLESLLLLSPTLDQEAWAALLKRAPSIGRRSQEVSRSLMGWDAVTSVGTEYKVPVVMFCGAYDWQTPVTLTRAYFDQISAPYRRYVEFEHSGHIVVLEEPGRLIVALASLLLPLAQGRTPPPDAPGRS